MHRPALRPFIKPSLANDDDGDIGRGVVVVVVVGERSQRASRFSFIFYSGDPTCMRTERESCALYALRRAEKQSGFDPLTVEIFFHGNKNFRREVSWIFISPSLFPFFFSFFFFF